MNNAKKKRETREILVLGAVFGVIFFYLVLFVFIMLFGFFGPRPLGAKIAIGVLFPLNVAISAFQSSQFNFVLHLIAAAATYSMVFVLVNKIYHYYRPLPPTEYVACRTCHYDLTGNESGTCPECGNAIELQLDDSV